MLTKSVGHVRQQTCRRRSSAATRSSERRTAASSIVRFHLTKFVFIFLAFYCRNTCGNEVGKLAGERASGHLQSLDGEASRESSEAGHMANSTSPAANASGRWTMRGGMLALAGES